MYNFDVILGIEWFSKHNAMIDYFSKTMTFKKSRDLEFTFQGERKVLSSCFIFMMAANRCLQKGCSAYLAYVINKDIQEANLETKPAVKEFPDIFPEKLTNLPFDRELEFTIDLIPNRASIS